MISVSELQQEIEGGDDLLDSLRRLTHGLKGTVGAIRMAAASEYVKPPARELIEEAVVRLQEYYRAYESAARKLRHQKEAQRNQNRR